jgi:hypothetical protein
MPKDLIFLAKGFIKISEINFDFLSLFIADKLMYKQNGKKRNEQSGADLVNNGKSRNAVNVHNNYTRDKGDAVKYAHNNFKRGNLPFLPCQNGVCYKYENSDNGDGDMRYESRSLKQKQ